MNSILENLKNQFLNNTNLTDIATYVVGVVIVMVFLLAIFLITNSILKKIASRAKTELPQKIRKNLKVPIFLFITIMALWIPISIMEVSDTVKASSNKILTILIISVMAWTLIRLVGIIKHFVLKQYDINQKNNLKARKVYTQFKIIERVLNFIIILIAISLSLMTFESIQKIGVSIIASAGVTGIILGFAAQKVLGGIFAGIQIAITQPIRIDDVVIVENEWGHIEEINLTYVVVSIWDKRRLVLPSTYFIEKPFQNWTRNSSDILGTVFIYTDYKVPFDEIRKELTRLLDETDLWNGQVNNVQVTNATEKTVEIRALVSADDSPTAWNLRVYVRENLIKFLQENYPDSLPRSRVEIETPDKKA